MTLINLGVHSMVLNVGLTGGIGSGKSEAESCFRDLGARVIDADHIARGLMEPGKAGHAFIHNRYGDQLFVDDVLQRDQLASIVFENLQERKALEAFLHPIIRKHIEDDINSELFTTLGYRVISIPLLVENLPFPILDRICVVDCPVDLQIQRIRKRDGLSDTQILQRLDAQATREERLAHADDVIENTGNLSSLRKQVKALHKKYSQWNNG